MFGSMSKNLFPIKNIMDLKTFVSNSLSQIVAGVNDANANQDVKDRTFMLNPFTSGSEKIDFDIAVTVSSSQEGKAEAGIKVISIGGAGAKVGNTHTNEIASRIKFSVFFNYLM